MSAVIKPRPDSSSRGLGLATVLMCTLAAGAIWCVLTLYLSRNLSILAVPIAVILAAVLRSHGYAATLLGTVLAAACTLIACLYAQYLLATAQIASLLGLPMGMALMKIGPDMAFAVMKTRIGGWDLASMLGAALLSAALTRRPLRERA